MTDSIGLPDKIISKWPNVSKDPQRPVKSEAVYYHNWLYSVVPARMAGSHWVNSGSEYSSSKEESYPQVDIYLTGYCRTCGRAFSQPIPYQSNYLETQMNVSKEGCVAP